MTHNTLMHNKVGLITGITNEYSIAWAISQQLIQHGSHLIISYPNDKIKTRIEKLLEQHAIKDYSLLHCDATQSDSIDNTMTFIKEKYHKIDFMLHAIAFSDKNELKNRFLDTTLDNFLLTMHISCYSLIELCKKIEPLLNHNASIITLTYYGAEKVMPNYNVMGVAKAALEASVRYLAMELGSNGIRINAISAGPIKTLAASGIGDFGKILSWNAEHSPLQRNITQAEIAKSALYLFSDLASGVTGEIHYVDAGYNIVGMKNNHNSQSEQ